MTINESSSSIYLGRTEYDVTIERCDDLRDKSLLDKIQQLGIINTLVIKSCYQLPEGRTLLTEEQCKHLTSLTTDKIPQAYIPYLFSKSLGDLLPLCHNLKTLYLHEFGIRDTSDLARGLTHCTSLEALDLSNLNPTGGMFDLSNEIRGENQNTLFDALAKCVSLRSLIFPNEITEENGAKLSDCTQLEHIVCYSGYHHNKRSKRPTSLICKTSLFSLLFKHFFADDKEKAPKKMRIK